MIRQILFSQLVAMIKVSFNTKKITACDGTLTFMAENRLKNGMSGQMLRIKWKRGQRCSGRETMYLCMSLQEKSKQGYILHAYYFDGDNCNMQTRFLYEVMANEIDIVDDLGIVGYGIDYRKNLININPFDVRLERLKAENPELFGGK